MSDVLVKFSDFVKLPLKCFKVFGLIPHKSGEIGPRKRKFLAVYYSFVLANLTIALIGIAVCIKKTFSDSSVTTKEPVSAFSYTFLDIVKTITF